jgi:hypothetical protein
MNRLHVSPLLRLALRLDAAASVGVGALTLALASPLTPILGAPKAWVLAAGVFLLAYGIAVGWFALRTTLARTLAWTVIVGNVLWAVHTGLLGFTGLIAPTTLGLALILGQAAAVLLLADLQYFGLRRSTAQAPA